jgi:lysozyme
MQTVIDISDDQGTIDFAAVKASGQIAAVVIKATEGITLQMDRFKEYHDGFKAVGIPVGMYHFFRGNDDGEAQANNFLTAIDGYQGTVRPMVDCETQDGTDPTTYLQRLGKFLKKVDKTLRPGVLTMIYFKYSMWTDWLGGYGGYSGHPAWPAAYNNDADLDMTGTGWSHWTLWQYSDGSGLDAIPGIAANVDRDRLAGSLETILR